MIVSGAVTKGGGSFSKLVEIPVEAMFMAPPLSPKAKTVGGIYTWTALYVDIPGIMVDETGKTWVDESGNTMVTQD